MRARIEFGSGVEWVGELDGDSFLVEEILDHGKTEAELTGAAPSMTPVPLTDIRRLGGMVRPVGK